jgi:hypothetical protein
MVRQMTKRYYFEHLFRLFLKADDVRAMMRLLGKLVKLSKGHADYRIPSDLQVGVKLQVAPCKAFDELSIEDNVRFYYYMLQVGSTYLVDLLRKESKDSILPPKLEGHLLRVRDEVKFRVNREDTNYYLNRIEEFRVDYQKRFRRGDDDQKNYRKVRYGD